MPEQSQYTAADLRAQADAMEKEQALVNRGKVFIDRFNGMGRIHEGTAVHQTLTAGDREASEAELQALRSIPEFSAHLDRVRGKK